ncbi:hypothetical protein ABZV91_20420 [Nocardia sp. NPDC004568]|uniref:hypothetical protein n=1 Tax=Nocardia sp. NPDC004568 TaxID=3154551 RepID=UPI0033A21697
MLGADAVRIMLAAALNHPTPDRAPLDAREVAAQVVSRVAETRATWQINHLRAETERRIRCPAAGA